MTIKIYLMIGIILLSSSLVLSQPFYYDIKMKYNAEKGIEVISTDVFFSYDVNTINEGYGDNILKLRDSSGNVISSKNFLIPNVLIAEDFDENGGVIFSDVIELNQTEFSVYVPYNEKANEIVVYDSNGEKVVREDVSMYSKELVKDSGEVLSRDDKSMSRELGNWNYFWIVLIAGVVVLVIVLFFILKKNK